MKAYYATAAADGELTLSEIADGIIPAYTGAILAATAKRTGFADNANYMLGVDNDSEVKFLQATITTVPANKAYLPAANVTNGRSSPSLSHLREVGSPQVFNVIFFIMSGQFEVIRAALFIGSKWGVSPAAGSVAGLVLTYSATCEIPPPPPRTTSRGTTPSVHARPPPEAQRKKSSHFFSSFNRLAVYLHRHNHPQQEYHTMLDVKKLLGDCEDKMEMSVMHLEETLAQIRAGKANVHILDDLRVNSYGSMVPINNVAAVTTPDARTIAIKPWDKQMFRVIEKAIIDSTIGIMPENNGEIIRLGIPPLTEERRRALTKQCAKEAEEAKVAIRNTRREGIDKLKKAVKEGLSEDIEKDAEADLQKIHDKKVKRIEEILADKNKEIMTV